MGIVMKDVSSNFEFADGNLIKQIVQQGLFLLCSLAVNDFKFGFKFFSAKQKTNVPRTGSEAWSPTR